MNVYIFQNYYDRGGCVIIADSLAQAIEIARNDFSAKIGEDEIKEMKVFKLSDDSTEPQMFMFQDGDCR